MESLFAPVELNRETTQMLDNIRSGAENVLYGTAPADAEEKIRTCVLSMIEGAGLPNLQVIHYRWYLRELARLWRTRTGRDLAFHLELCLRKWVGLGLEPRTLQFLVCEFHERLKAVTASSEVRNQNAEVRTTDARPETCLSTESADVPTDVSDPTNYSATMAARPCGNWRKRRTPAGALSAADPKSLGPSAGMCSHSTSSTSRHQL